MIARRIDSGPARLGVLVELDAEGRAELIVGAADSTEYAEALRRLRRWIHRRELDALLADVEGAGRDDA